MNSLVYQRIVGNTIEFPRSKALWTFATVDALSQVERCIARFDDRSRVTR